MGLRDLVSFPGSRFRFLLSTVVGKRTFTPQRIVLLAVRKVRFRTYRTPPKTCMDQEPTGIHPSALIGNVERIVTGAGTPCRPLVYDSFAFADVPIIPCLYSWRFVCIKAKS
jgi:hypothetical protein